MNGLSLSDLYLFGISSILGSGGFNLIGNAMISGKDYFPFALAASGALFTGSAYSYNYAHDRYGKNDSETHLVSDVFGPQAKVLSNISVLGYNIIAVAVVLVLSSKLLLPNSSWYIQVGFAAAILGLMTVGAFQKLDINTSIINLFSCGIIAILGFISLLGLTHIHADTSLGSTDINLYESFLYFFFILAGHDTLIKFSEETARPKDIDASFFISIASSFALIAGVCVAALVYIIDFSKIDINNIISILYAEVFNRDVGILVKYAALVLMTSTVFLNFLATIRYYNSMNGKKVEDISKKSIFTIACSIALIIFINNIETLVTLADFGLIITLLSVSAAACIDRYKKGQIPWIDGFSTVGLTGVLGLITAKNIHAI
jgi:hypothetical protein